MYYGMDVAVRAGNGVGLEGSGWVYFFPLLSFFLIDRQEG